jgi:hypothetical protein
MQMNQSDTKTGSESAVEATCVGCGMERNEWGTPAGVEKDGDTYCCTGCATGGECTCP